MNARLLNIGLLFVFSSLADAATHAAPPVVNTFYPAGGQRGTTVTVAVDGAFTPWPVRAWVNGQGVEVTPAKEKGKLTVTIDADAVPGAYGIRLFNAEGSSIARPFLVGTLPEIMEQEPNDDFKKPQLLDKKRVLVNGRLDKPGDVDTFALSLRRGQTLIAALEANRTLRSPMDGHLQVVSAEGFVLDHNDDFHGLDPQIVFPVPSDGTYLVRAFAFPAVPDSTIRFAGGDKFIYRLTLTTGPFFDYAYPLAVSLANPGKVDMIGWNLPPALHTLSVEPRPDSDEALLFHGQAANGVRVRLEPHTTSVKASTNSRTNPQKIDLPNTITGRLEKAGDVDCYQFDGRKGQKLLFRAEAQSLGFPLDPVLSIADRDGKKMAKAQATALGQDPTLSVTIPHDGSYFLEVRDLHGLGSFRHVYRLQAGAPLPDFTLKLATDRFTVLSGKPLDIPVTIERSNGFSDEIELAAMELPEGVTAANLPTDNKKAKTLTLRLTADKGPYAGPIRIIGKSKALGQTRNAQATVAELGTLTAEFWLTVAQR